VKHNKIGGALDCIFVLIVQLHVMKKEKMLKPILDEP
jgi:hypothetical protein